MATTDAAARSGHRLHETQRIPIFGRSEYSIQEWIAGSTSPDGIEPGNRDDGLILHVHRRACPFHEMRDASGRREMGPVAEGDAIPYRPRDLPKIQLAEPADILVVHIPKATFGLVADQTDAIFSETLSVATGVPFKDEGTVALASSLATELNADRARSGQYLAYVGLAMIVHIGTLCGALVPRSSFTKGGLAPWQARRAKDLIEKHLDSDANLSDIARECGLSLSHFSRAFRRTIGMPPHAWLMGRRLEKAKSLMRDSHRSLSDIALSCGFADQSHFTRAFSREVGSSPGLWRRLLETPEKTISTIRAPEFSAAPA